MITPTRLWIPRRTQLMTVWRVENGWRAFTACPDVHAPYNEMLGTSLMLRDDGTAARCVWRPDHNDDEMEIMT